MRVILIVLPVFVLGAWASTSGPEVLVVGEDKHAHVARLPNPGFEAIDMSSALWRPGLEPMKEHRAARIAPTGTGSTRAAQERLSAPRSFRGLVSDVAQVRGVQRVRQLRIATVAAEADTEGDAEPPIFALLEQRVVPGGLRRERFPQLSYDQFVVVVRDAAGRELDWRLVRNPAIVRADVTAACKAGQSRSSAPSCRSRFRMP